MEAHQNSGDALNALETMLWTCDICLKPATNPVGTNCGHLSCWSCLSESFLGQQARPCPVCRTDLQQELTVLNFPIHAHDGSMGSATTSPATSTHGGQTSGSSVGMPPNVVLNARLEVVQDYLDEGRDDIHALQLDLCGRLSELRAERIRRLEQVVENLVEMNSALLRQVEGRDQEMTTMSRRIAELENPTVRGGNTFAMRRRRFGREITPTEI